MKIKTVHQFKLPYSCKIKGLNLLLNNIVERIENYILKKSSINSCVKGNVLFEKKIILSLTTYPARTDKVYWTIKSLLNQTVRIDKFILWLAEEQYPNKKVPSKLREYEQYGLEILFCDDLKSHKKYYYAMKEFSNAIIITVDDDAIYPEDTLEKLLRMHQRFPNAVICNQARWITKNGEGLLPYSKWPVVLPKSINQPQSNILPIGVGGVLYPPGCLDDRVFDKDKIFEIAISADDLWLKVMALLNGTKAMVSCKKQRRLCGVRIQCKDDSCLQQVNVIGGKNDLVIKKLLDEFPRLLETLQ